MKKYFWLLLLVFIAGCTQTSLDFVFNNLPQVQDFLDEHPNARVIFTFWSSEEINNSIGEISMLCEKNITVQDMFFARLSEDSMEIVAWFDTNYNPLCVVKKEQYQESNISEEEILLNETSNFVLSYELVNGCVELDWYSYPNNDLRYYKVVRNTTVTSPKYPDNGYISVITSRLDSNYTDCDYEEGTNYYGITIVKDDYTMVYTNSIMVENLTRIEEEKEFTLQEGLFNINGFVEGDCLHLSWDYSDISLLFFKVLKSTFSSNLTYPGDEVFAVLSNIEQSFVDCEFDKNSVNYYKVVAGLTGSNYVESIVFVLDKLYDESISLQSIGIANYDGDISYIDINKNECGGSGDLVKGYTSTPMNRIDVYINDSFEKSIYPAGYNFTGCISFADAINRYNEGMTARMFYIEQGNFRVELKGYDNNNVTIAETSWIVIVNPTQNVSIYQVGDADRESWYTHTTYGDNYCLRGTNLLAGHVSAQAHRVDVFIDGEYQESIYRITLNTFDTSEDYLLGIAPDPRFGNTCTNCFYRTCIDLEAGDKSVEVKSYDSYNNLLASDSLDVLVYEGDYIVINSIGNVTNDGGFTYKDYNINNSCPGGGVLLEGVIRVPMNEVRIHFGGDYYSRIPYYNEPYSIVYPDSEGYFSDCIIFDVSEEVQSFTVFAEIYDQPKYLWLTDTLSINIYK